MIEMSTEVTVKIYLKRAKETTPLQFICNVASVPRKGEHLLFPISNKGSGKWSGAVKVEVDDVTYLACLGRDFAEKSFSPVIIFGRASKREFLKLSQLRQDLDLHAAA